ncbi:MAG: hypothetical protein ACJAVR_002658 [Paracoccaceae bacterium]|jgi:hypothetical protein
MPELSVAQLAEFPRIEQTWADPINILTGQRNICDLTMRDWTRDGKDRLPKLGT